MYKEITVLYTYLYHWPKRLGEDGNYGLHNVLPIQCTWQSDQRVQWLQRMKGIAE
jgi:hypothetical protein